MALTAGWYVLHQLSGARKDLTTGAIAFFTEITYSNGSEFRYGRATITPLTPTLTPTQMDELETAAADNAGLEEH